MQEWKRSCRSRRREHQTGGLTGSRATLLQYMTGTEQFISSLVSSLAWPGAAVGIAVLFRRQLGALLSTSLRKLKVGPFEAEFDRVLASVEAELGQEARPALPPKGMRSPGTTQNSAPLSLLDELGPLAVVSPRAAIIEGHMRLERELWDLTHEFISETSRGPLGAVRLARLALEHGLITPETENAIVGVTTLRNLAAHGRDEDISVERAMDYLALVDGVLFAIRQNSRG